MNPSDNSDVHLQQTLDATPANVAIDSPQRPRVALVEGSHASLSSVSNELLRDRLRLASILLFAGFLSFLLLRLGIYIIFGESEAFATGYLSPVILVAHIAVTLVTGMIGIRLCSNCAVIRKHLRIVEVLVFGGSAAFFALWSYANVTHTAATNHYISPMAAPWLLLLFTYALFIPNTWQRAAAAIALMALTPIAIHAIASLTSADFANLIGQAEYRTVAISTVMVMILGGTTAVWGVYTIRSLRREAFEAQRLGQYQLKRKLGEGGMGEVYLAEHLLLKRPCAVKVIRPDKAGNPQTLARFEREVQSTARLTHWNTVEIFDYGNAADGTFYYVMEYLPGMNLDQLVAMHGRMPAERVIYLLAQACDALAEAHHEGLIHRDIKPANIFSARRGGHYDVVKLLDFGLVRAVGDANDVALRQEGVMTGSPQSMSPEQASGDTPDERSDIYSLGVVAYYLLAGRAPFVGDNVMKVILAHARDAAPPIHEFAPDVPSDIADVVMRCLEKDPEHRFPSVDALRDAIDNCDASGLWDSKRADDWWRNHGCPKKKELDERVLEAVG